MQVGQTFNHGFVVSEKVYNGFIQTFGDRNPLHTDEDFARNMGFESKVMHGNILNGFLSYFIGECLPQKNVFILSQEIAYNKPVYLNDEIDLSAKIVEIHESVNVVEIKYVFNKKGGPKVASGIIKIGYR